MEYLSAQHRFPNIAVWHPFGESAAHRPLALPHILPKHIKNVLPDIFYHFSVKNQAAESPLSPANSPPWKMLEPCKVLVEERRRWIPPPVAPPGTKQLSADLLNVSSCPYLPAGAELLSYAVGPAYVQWTGCRSHLIIIEVIRKERNKGKMEGRKKHMGKYSIILG